MDIESQWQGILLEDNSKENPPAPIKGWARPPPPGTPTLRELWAGNASYFSSHPAWVTPIIPHSARTF